MCGKSLCGQTWEFHWTEASLWSSGLPALHREGRPGDKPERGPRTSAVALIRSRCHSMSAHQWRHGRTWGCTTAAEHTRKEQLSFMALISYSLCTTAYLPPDCASAQAHSFSQLDGKITPDSPDLGWEALCVSHVADNWSGLRVYWSAGDLPFK